MKNVEITCRRVAKLCRSFESLREAARAMDVDYSALYRIVRGHVSRSPSLDTLQRIAAYHRMTLEELTAP